MTNRIGLLEVILKVAERCNINCSYCYYFNGANSDFEGKPPYIDQATVESVAHFLRQTAVEHAIESVQIDLHGGEPLMLKRERFRQMLMTFREILGPVVDLTLAVQTNAMLVTEAWIDLFDEFNVSVSASLDGPREINDKYRIDHQGRGTYDRSMTGLKHLIHANESRRVYAPGIISVVTPDNDAGAIYRHFIGKVGLKRLHLLLPDHSHDTVDLEDMPRYKASISAAMDEWLAGGVGTVNVRMFDLVLRELTQPANSTHASYAAVTIRSDGALNPPDDMRNAAPELFHEGLNAATHTFQDYLDDTGLALAYTQLSTIPDACSDCGFRNICRGGELFTQPEHRHKSGAGFSQKSVYCEIYEMVMLRMVTHLVSKGYPWKRIEERLHQPNSALEHSFHATIASSAQSVQAC